MTAWTIMGQNFSSLEYGNCQGLTLVPMSMQCFLCEKVNLEKKICSFPFRNMMLQHLIIQFSLHHLSSGPLWEVKKRKFQTFSSKIDCGHLGEVVAYKRFQLK